MSARSISTIWWWRRTASGPANRCALAWGAANDAPTGNSGLGEYRLWRPAGRRRNARMPADLAGRGPVARQWRRPWTAGRRDRLCVRGGCGRGPGRARPRHGLGHPACACASTSLRRRRCTWCRPMPSSTDWVDDPDHAVRSRVVTTNVGPDDPGHDELSELGRRQPQRALAVEVLQDLLWHLRSADRAATAIPAMRNGNAYIYTNFIANQRLYQLAGGDRHHAHRRSVRGQLPAELYRPGQSEHEPDPPLRPGLRPGLRVRGRRRGRGRQRRRRRRPRVGPPTTPSSSR